MSIMEVASVVVSERDRSLYALRLMWVNRVMRRRSVGDSVVGHNILVLAAR